MSFGKTNYRTGGTRGGANQFKWDDVKNDKYRENYLGHSVNAPVGRWQKGKDLTWYAKTSKEQRALELKQELLLAKQRDEDLMNQALGLAPRRREEPTGELDASEMKELLKRGESERDGLMAERIEGLGAAPVTASGVDTAPKKTLAERYKEQLESGKQDTTFALPGTISVNEAHTANGSRSETKEEREARKAAKKLKRKGEKKVKKERKRERKEQSKATSSSHRHRRDSGSDSEEEKRGLNISIRPQTPSVALALTREEWQQIQTTRVAIAIQSPPVERMSPT
ncbi:T-complex protein 1 subunit zeta [Globisporangium polare]